MNSLAPKQHNRQTPEDPQLSTDDTLIVTFRPHCTSIIPLFCMFLLTRIRDMYQLGTVCFFIFQTTFENLQAATSVLVQVHNQRRVRGLPQARALILQQLRAWSRWGPRLLRQFDWRSLQARTAVLQQFRAKHRRLPGLLFLLIWRSLQARTASLQQFRAWSRQDPGLFRLLARRLFQARAAVLQQIRAQPQRPLRLLLLLLADLLPLLLALLDSVRVLHPSQRRPGWFYLFVHELVQRHALAFPFLGFDGRLYWLRFGLLILFDKLLHLSRGAPTGPQK
mmetsp:Transcript_22182/g.47720  ORF Transcript_22182/g.47720 Transcript_22182/m.47720 type:complete len:280 (+) Transcript_22182:73-912(+)